jgi:hypothetical protein
MIVDTLDAQHVARNRCGQVEERRVVRLYEQR